jgi:hypothetical protein
MTANLPWIGDDETTLGTCAQNRGIEMGMDFTSAGEIVKSKLSIDNSHIRYTSIFDGLNKIKLIKLSILSRLSRTD